MKDVFVAAIAVAVMLVIACGASWAALPGQSLGRTRSSVERISPERLEAAHNDVLKHQAGRETLPPLEGLTDYRASIHVHADDSSHTGGTLPELLEDSKKADVQIVMLSDHFRPPKDFMDGWRGIRDGVLFIPGSEGQGFLLYPDASVMDVMDGPKEKLIEATTQGSGLIFLSHVEARVDHPMDGLTGMEMYNRHADAEDDMSILFALVSMMTDPAKLPVLEGALEQYHDEFLACQLDYPEVYVKKWDEETQKQRVVGIAAIDCHHNQVLVMKMVDDRTVLVGTSVDDDEDMRSLSADNAPGIAEMTQGHKPGDILARLDLDTYFHSFRTVANHILAPELSEEAVRAALRAGHVYVGHDWMCDATGFRFLAQTKDRSERHMMGDELPFGPSVFLLAEFPATCNIRLLKNGEAVSESEAAALAYAPDGPGVYRVEGWLKVDGEDRVWIYSNPIYLR